MPVERTSSTTIILHGIVFFFPLEDFVEDTQVSRHSPVMNDVKYNFKRPFSVTAWTLIIPFTRTRKCLVSQIQPLGREWSTVSSFAARERGHRACATTIPRSRIFARRCTSHPSDLLRGCAWTHRVVTRVCARVCVAGLFNIFPLHDARRPSTYLPRNIANWFPSWTTS